MAKNKQVNINTYYERESVNGSQMDINRKENMIFETDKKHLFLDIFYINRPVCI
jgi:hypothetical protein